MKTNQLITTVLLISILALGIVSCSSTRTAVSCPEFTVKKNDYNGHTKRKYSRNLFAQKNSVKKRKSHRNESVTREEINISSKITDRESILQIDRLEYSKGLLASADNSLHPLIKPAPVRVLETEYYNSDSEKRYSMEKSAPCDTIFLRSGAIILGKVEEIGYTEVKYRRCDNLTGPVISLFKSDIARIQYTNGTSEYFKPAEQIPANRTMPEFNNVAEPKAEGFGVAGFISGLVGLFVASIPLGIIAIVFGGISLSKINKNPGRFKGRGFAVTSIILGIIDVVAMIVLLAAVV